MNEWERAYAEAYPDRLREYVEQGLADAIVPDGGVTDEPPVPESLRERASAPAFTCTYS